MGRVGEGTTRAPRDGEVPGVDYNFISVEQFKALEDSGALLESGTYDGNFYGTPKPPAEPSPFQPDPVDQVLFDNEFDTESQRKRTTSVSKMERMDSSLPEEEEDEDKEAVNGSGNAELPYGWEKIEDPQYGTYYVDHLNQKTQFENPVEEAKRKKQLGQADTGSSKPDTEKSHFTRDPSQLKGILVRASLKKSTMGFGFTIIGGDRPDEFLQVKNVLKDGPAAQDGKIAPGDVIVDINGSCVLGHTHADVVQMFQLVPVNQYVNLTLCRGYPLPDDNEDPVMDIVAAIPVINGQSLTKGETGMNTQDFKSGAVVLDQNGKSGHTLISDRLNGPSDLSEQRASMASSGSSQPELVTIPLIKGPKGFGFAIADSPTGQKNLTHLQVVEVLKQFPVGADVPLLILRGAPNTKDLDVFLRKQESGFGFRVLGGDGPDQSIYIGAIIPLGAAEKDGRLRAADELMCIDGIPVKGKSHKQVLDLMTTAARNGHVLLTVRRKIFYGEKQPEDDSSQAFLSAQNGSPRLNRAEVPARPAPQEAYDVVLQRKENEGFGFVILTSKNKPPPGVLVAEDFFEKGTLPFTVLSFPEKKYLRALKRSQQLDKSGVIPHKIGRVIEGSPADRCGKLKVGDHISAVNGQSIVELSHDNIVQLIKDAGVTVTLTVIPEEAMKQKPNFQKFSIFTAVGATGEPFFIPTRNATEGEAGKDVSISYRHSWSDHKHLAQPDTATISVIGTRHSQSLGCYPVELERGPRGFGFSLRGGKEYNMALFILRLAEDGPAIKDGRIHVGDQIVEINGEPTQGITHTRAIELIQAGGNKVLLLLRPGTGLIPDHGPWKVPSAGRATGTTGVAEKRL
ncbi:membrane-associated guanylate kinase, WW and PDZ domain-containing protein 3 [Camelus ferus]|nr:membrane-associated guanylate kinase, WW and PDZ domain-containing protein 3 [Camelus ferus]